MLGEYLTRHRISSMTFAKKVGVSYSSICKYRRGARWPKHDIMKKIWLKSQLCVSIADWTRQRKLANGRNNLTKKKVRI